MAAVLGLQFTFTCKRMKRSARSATDSSGSGGAGIGSSPRFMRSMTTATCFLLSSVKMSPWRPRVTRLSPIGPLDCTT